MNTTESKNTNNNSNKSRDSRKPLDASHGKDRIEIEKKEAKRFNDMDKFAPMDGDLGDESKDNKDLPVQERKNKNDYDPAMGVGGKRGDENPNQPEGMHITSAGKSGIVPDQEDSYVDEDGLKKIAEEKRKNQKDVQNPGNKKS